MPVDLLWSPQAREDLLDVYLTIGMDNADAAERIYTAIENKAGLLIEHPQRVFDVLISVLPLAS